MATPFTKTRTQADDAKGVALVRDGTDQRCAVDGVGDGAVHDVLDAHFGEGWHPLERAFEYIGDPVQIVGAKGIHEVRVDPVHPPCAAVLFVEAYQQAVLFLTAVIVADRAAQEGHAVARLGNGRDVFGDEILMLHRHDRMVHAHHRAHFVHAVAAGVYNNLAGDIAMLCVHGPVVVFVLG